MRKKQYMIGLDLNDEEQERLRKFSALSAEKSVRAFVKSAIFNEITTRLRATPVTERKAVERIISA